ncbi:Ig-like domain-containing protein [Cupriavidus malaysiensis]|uniref:DUF4165 domain-containing protein n=1 Tax=Cupriavidus malaysiensis TaxID=367825 RepID=A0ABM6FGW1_9BURK|nr:Ig-like domain-containing protein [Cupriavidus malaysiensis]AOZ11191.1 hypothetical protein BKK80_35145 [Cupriavidus malaysiensis]
MNRVKSRAAALSAALLAGTAALGTSLSANAELLQLQFQDKRGTVKTVAPGDKYVNPVGDITFALSGGLARSVRITIQKEQSTLTVGTAQSGVLGADSTMTIGGQSYYGALLKLPAPVDGSYILKAEILASNGQTVQADTYPIVIDTVGPTTTGAMDVRRNYGSFGTISQFGTGSSQMLAGLQLDQISDPSGLASAKYFAVSRVDGVRREAAATLDAARGVVTVPIEVAAGKALAPTNRSHYTVGFTVTDRAGNETTFSRDSAIDNELPQYWLEVYDSRQAKWVPYVAGTVVYENPVKTRWKFRKSDHVAYNGSEYGWKEVYKTSEDSSYVYHEQSIPIPIPNTYYGYVATSAGIAFPAYYSSFSGLKLSPDVDQAPKGVKAQMQRDGGPWEDLVAAPGLPRYGNKPWTVTGVKVFVEARNYDQKARVLLRSIPYTCLIPTGQTTCEMQTNDRFDSGFGYDSGPWYLAKANGAMEVFGGTYVYRWWDFNPPVVDQMQVDLAKGTASFRATDLDSTDDWRYYMWTVSSIRAYLKDASGATYALPKQVTNKLAYNSWSTSFGLSGAPDGVYTLVGEAEDNYGNVGQAVFQGSVTLDRTAPAIALTVGDGQAIRSLDDFTISVSDTVDPSPRVTSAVLQGGPANQTINLAWRQTAAGDGATPAQYRLEYPVLAPSLESGRPYVLTVKAVDSSGNVGKASLSFNYAPAQVPLQNERKQPIRIPALKTRNTIFQETLQSEPIRLPDNSLVGGVYPIYATLRADSTAPMVVGGVTVQPGETKTVDSAYDFSANKGRYSLVVNSASDSTVAGGVSTLIMTTAAPNAPVGIATVTFWDPADQIGVTTFDGKSDYVAGLETFILRAKVNTQSKDCIGGVYSIVPGSLQDPAFQTTRLATLAGGRAVCAVLFDDTIGAMDKTFTNYAGKLKETGPYDVKYEAGLLYRDPETNVVTFFSAVKPHAFPLTGVGIQSAKPEVKFTPESALARLGSTIDSPLTFVGNVIAGRLTIAGRFPGLHVKVNDGEAVKVVGSNNSMARQLTTDVRSLWETTPYKLTYWYDAAPDQVWTTDLSMLSVPTTISIYTAPVREKQITTEETTVSGQIGAIVAGKFVYDPVKMGEWRISVFQKKVRYVNNKGVVTLEPLTTEPLATEADGSFSVNLGALQAGGNSVFVEAELVRDGALTGRKVKGFDTQIGVANGEPIEAVLKNMRQDSGMVGGKTAFRPVIGAYMDSKRTMDIGTLTWYESRDRGTTWSVVQESRQTGYTPVITEPGTFMYRATVKNRHSGATFDTNTITVEGFARPDLDIHMPRAGFVGRPVTVTAESSVANTVYTWTVKGSTKDAVEQTFSGSSFSFTPEVAGVYKIALSGRVDDGQNIDNQFRVRTASASYRAIPLSIPVPIIRGPNVTETGKRYTFTVQQGSPFTSTETNNETISGKWILPNGREVEGFDPVDYTVLAGDQEVRFESWVDGRKGESLRTGSYRLRSWTYQFPQMRMTVTKYDMRVPARANFSIGYVAAADATKTGGEKFSFEWTLPAGAAIASQSGNAIGVDFTIPGEQRVSVTVRDTRGNEQVLQSDQIAVLPPTDLKASLSVTVGDKWMRAPDKVQAKVAVEQLPKNDVVARIDYSVDGEVVLTTTNSLTPAVLEIATPGEHTIVAKVTSRGGAVIQAAGKVTLVSGASPVCKIEASGSVSASLQLTARCSIETGRISGLRWLFDKRPTSITSSQVLFNPSTIANVNYVEVIATSDKGQTGTASWSK